jgi:pyruvate/2-oxoacid:ferredoxin oxidoreductase beta subunit
MNKPLFTSGHSACAGCGQAIAARLVVETAGANTIIANNTGCLEVFSTAYPLSCWNVPWIHSLFENAAAVASGIEAALKYLGKKETTNVICQAGDGGTADIGLQALSGMWERAHDILSICYDNEAYMNCLSLASLIMTKSGLKKITEIKLGEEIAAFDQNTHQLVYKHCSGIFDNGTKPVFELNTLHHTIKATANHPFLILKRNGRGKQNYLVWKTLEQVKIGDEVVVLKGLEQKQPFKFESIDKTKLGDYKVNKLNEINLPQSSSPALMKYLGLFVGDGWVRQEKGETGFALPSGKKGRKELLKIHKHIFGNSIRGDKNYVYINSVNLAKFINSLGFGQGAKHKTIPCWVFTLPQEEKECFVQGLMLADGYSLGESQRYVSASTDLLKRLRLLLQTIGYRVGKIHMQSKKKGSLCVYRPLLKDSEYGYICFSRRRKLDISRYGSQNRYRNFLVENEYFDTEKVKAVKFVSIEPTLDLRVEDQHNFIADGIVVHNTGIQRSGLTPFDTNTTTSPAGRESFGNPRPKKNVVEIAAAHGIPYVATASASFPADLTKKIKKAISIKGPKYIQIHVPCPLGWRYEPAQTLEVGKLAVETGLYPLVEFEASQLKAVKKISPPKPVEEYLKSQGRFKHLLKSKDEIAKIQAIADSNIKRYNLKD